MSTTAETQPANEDPNTGAQNTTEQDPGTPTQQAESLLLEVEHSHDHDKCPPGSCVDLHESA
ncbi:hypothetical protein [Actinocrispum sp. NPDC049592]|uniref:hypothetical protein n=1 Tax=Actinocrispum sp. NPDC049592 TaxID=3154835 RepID=UPI00343EA988